MAWRFYNDQGALKIDSGGTSTALDWKASVRFATTGNVTLSGLGTQGNGDWPGSMAEGDRVLVREQSTGSENGLYAASSGAWSRTTDADVDAEVTSGLAVFVEEGTTLNDTLWFLTTDNPITVDTTALTFTSISASINLADLADVNTTSASDGSLLRYEETGTVWEDTGTLLFDDNGRLQITTDGASAGVQIGSDVVIARVGANTVALATGDKIQSDVLATAGDDLTNQVYVDRMDMFFA